MLRSIDSDAPDAIWCLGDLVGYGPQPNRCCELVSQRADVCLIGNHDLGVLGRIDLENFAPDAAASARWTMDALEDGPRSYLESLEPSSVQGEVGLYHASPRDPVWEYVLTPQVATASILAADQPLVLVGHSHVALQFSFDGDALNGGLAPAGTTVPLPPAPPHALLNPGSVGQPRDGDPRAAYLLLDLDAGQASFRRVEYPIERTQAEIREHGLPEALAQRLADGV